MPNSYLEINPLQLDQTGIYILKTLIATIKEPFFSEQFYRLDVAAPSTPKILIPLIFLMQHSILVRPSKKNPKHMRVEVLGELIGEGGEGQVFESQGVLKSEKNFAYFPGAEDKKRVIKAIDLQNTPRKSIEREAKKTAFLSSTLKCKKPVFSHNYGFLIMRKAHKLPLSQLIEEIKSQALKPTILDLLLLTRSILNEIKKIHQKKYIHRDLKPSNIIVDLTKHQATLIDFSYAKEINPQRPYSNSTAGTILYFAPEGHTRIISPSLDIFSAGLIIAELWGHTLRYSDNSGLFQYFENLFEGMTLPETIKNSLNKIIVSTTQPEPTNRMTIDQAISLCNEMLTEPNLNQCIFASEENIQKPEQQTPEEMPIEEAPQEQDGIDNQNSIFELFSQRYKDWMNQINFDDFNDEHEFLNHF